MYGEICSYVTFDYPRQQISFRKPLHTREPQNCGWSQNLWPHLSLLNMFMLDYVILFNHLTKVLYMLSYL